MTAPSPEWIERIIRMDSVTHKSNEEVVRFLAPLLQETGLNVTEHEVVENGVSFKNLIAFNHSLEARDLLILNTHLDTVSPGNPSDWTKTHGDPFQATFVRDRVYGLGTADVKLDFLCKILGARNSRPWNRPFALVGTYGEERGLVGARELLVPKKIKPKYALVGEPSNLELIYAHKGHLIATLGIPLGNTGKKITVSKSWKGRAAHSSTPHLGENAIEKALREIAKKNQGVAWFEGGTDINKIPPECTVDMLAEPNEGTKRLLAIFRFLEQWGKELKRKKDSRFSPSTCTLSLNLARMHQQELHLTFDIRVIPEADIRKMEEKIRRSAKAMGYRVVELSLDVPLRGEKNSAFMKAAAHALKSTGTPVVKKTKASSTEAAIYNHFGAEAIVFGPGLSIGNVHRPNEYNSLKQMNVATRFYAAMLRMPAEGF